MKKIISLFKRNYETNHLIRNEVVEGAEWVINGEGVATRKYDGTCCMMRDGVLYKRYDAKNGKTPLPGFEPAQDPDPVTGHWPGWVLVRDIPEDKWHIEALENIGKNNPKDGTYELVGPRIQGNPEGFKDHRLIKHAVELSSEEQHSSVADAPRTFDALRDYLKDKDIEGIVWHHPDGRMVKIKKKDFGFKRHLSGGKE